MSECVSGESHTSTSMYTSECVNECVCSNASVRESVLGIRLRAMASERDLYRLKYESLLLLNKDLDLDVECGSEGVRNGGRNSVSGGGSGGVSVCDSKEVSESEGESEGESDNESECESEGVSGVSGGVSEYATLPAHEVTDTHSLMDEEIMSECGSKVVEGTTTTCDVPDTIDLEGSKRVDECVSDVDVTLAGLDDMCSDEIITGTLTHTHASLNSNDTVSSHGDTTVTEVPPGASEVVPTKKESESGKTTHTHSRSRAVVDESLLGRYIRNDFPGYGVFCGVVHCYVTPYYRICYEDGDSEEMSEREVKALLLPLDSHTHTHTHTHTKGKASGGLPRKAVRKKIFASVEAFKAQMKSECGSSESKSMSECGSESDSNESKLPPPTTEEKVTVREGLARAVECGDVKTIASLCYSNDNKRVLDTALEEDRATHALTHTAPTTATATATATATTNDASAGVGECANDDCDSTLRFTLSDYYTQAMKILSEWRTTHATAVGTLVDIYSERWQMWYRAKVVPTVSERVSEVVRDRVRIHYPHWSKSHEECMSLDEWSEARVVPSGAVMSETAARDNNRSSGRVSRVSKKRSSKRRSNGTSNAQGHLRRKSNAHAYSHTGVVSGSNSKASEAVQNINTQESSLGKRSRDSSH